MVVHLYANCWNEMKILPFVVDYWKRFVTKAFVYDNGSTDGSVEFLQSFDWIEVRHFDSDGFNDQTIVNLKNTEWKRESLNADWVVVCDIDECIYHNDIQNVLQTLKDNHICRIEPIWIEMVSEEFPIYEEGKLLHEICKRGKKGSESKFSIFDPSKVHDMGYVVGCHKAHTIFKPNVQAKEDKVSLYLFHCKQLNVEYVINRYKDLQERLSALNRRNKWGVQYLYTIDKIKSDHTNLLDTSSEIKELIQ